MPKTKTDYSKTVIYKIVCNDLSITNLYVGSTTNFINRKYAHKASCNNQEDLNVYNFINSNGGWEAWDMIEIEKYPCKDNNEARARERFWYEQLNANLNMIKPYRSNEDNILYFKEYKENNVEKIKKSQKKYRAEHNEKIKIYKIENKEKCNIYKKNYVLKNLEIVKNSKKIYREKNREELNRKSRDKYFAKKLFSVLPNFIL